MSLDYGNTCPSIDESLGNVRSDVNHHMESMISDIVIEIEKVRSSNEDMREAADEQINSLKEDIDILNDELTEARQEVENLKAELLTFENDR